MSLLKKTTDYAFRLLVSLARVWPKRVISARKLAKEESVSYQFTCKILQLLHEKHLVESVMGPRGGYRLSQSPERIYMLEVIEAMQGPLVVNKCMLNQDECSRRPCCPIVTKLDIIQHQMETYFRSVSLEELAGYRHIPLQQYDSQNEAI